MARVRLFAGLRQAAGTGEVVIDGGSVDEVLAAAAATYGSDFERGLSTAKVWVNGEPAEAATPVGSDDEIAVLPPVSGGSVERADQEHGDVAVATPVFQTPVLPLLAWAALLAGNLASARWFSILLVGVAGAWIWDTFDEAARRGGGMSRWPALVAIVASVGAAWTWSSEGLGVAVALTVLAALTWSVVTPAMHSVDAAAGTVLAATVAGIGTGALVLVRLGAHGESRVSSFLIILLVAHVVMWLRLGSEDAGFMDPHTAAAIAALIAGVATGIVWETSLLAMVIAAAAVAAAFLAGRAFGSALRTGDLYLLEDLPGFLVPLDGALLAAPLFWVVLAMVA
ncbi:MAG: MoaD/ThiS family protein [Acidimicrobiia bacterium]|nr:MoaD/ThiS family protein [Acidimicrobiia bacterium]NNL98241.1 MoaD/ThiS family protein [Acidimicrobiia bacterium]